ncbi:hypothetical protein PRUPE_6G059900 [Prunus persica]|uniref:ABC1 atypical kinase-like domain-containing protein n=1 Tax=Prunus persica TaxID=3760 RepID=M5W5K1_PRUPE|nr:hypothetical protein PRUPE_6G059900 [Prunus persica]
MGEPSPRNLARWEELEEEKPDPARQEEWSYGVGALSLCTKLSELHTKAPEHSFAYTKKTIELAFGRKLPEIFDNFEEKPVKPIVVAVKLRHPGVCESIRRDFVIINLVAKISNFIPALKWWRLDESVQQVAVFIMSQVDLAREAAHLCILLFWWKLINKFCLVSFSLTVLEIRCIYLFGCSLLNKLQQVEEASAFWGTPEGDLVHPAECMQQLLEKVRRHRVNVDGNVCTVMVTTSGWQRKLDPGYNVMQTLLLKAD